MLVQGPIQCDRSSSFIIYTYLNLCIYILMPISCLFKKLILEELLLSFELLDIDCTGYLLLLFCNQYVYISLTLTKGSL